MKDKATEAAHENDVTWFVPEVTVCIIRLNTYS